MTSPSHDGPLPRALALRACGAGVGAVGGALAVALAVGLVPDGERAYVWLGTGAAAVVGSIGLLVQTRLSTGPGHDQRAATRLVLGMAGNLLLLAGVMVAGCLGLWVAQVKFAAVAAFGLAFAAAATCLHTVGVVVVARALLQHDRGAVPAAGARGGNAR